MLVVQAAVPRTSDTNSRILWLNLFMKRRAKDLNQMFQFGSGNWWARGYSLRSINQGTKSRTVRKSEYKLKSITKKACM